MTGKAASKKIGRGFERNLNAGVLQPMVTSFDLHLRAERKSPKTIRTYIEAAVVRCFVSASRWDVGLVRREGAA
jgi:hypothetical protein